MSFKILILAGGLGSRLGKHTRNKPKCMVRLFDKPLIQYQKDVLDQMNLNDLVIIRKHLADQIQIEGARYIDEYDYSTHMVVGLFEAEEEFNQNILITYGDIIYDQSVVESVIKSANVDCGLVVDTDWKEYWQARCGSYLNDAESLQINKNGLITNLGRPNPTEDEMDARYVGMIFFNERILPRVSEIYHQMKELHWDTPWYHSSSFKSSYMTDFLQCLIDQGIEITAIPIQRGWLEFDTEDDLDLAQNWLNSGKLGEFINLPLYHEGYKWADPKLQSERNTYTYIPLKGKFHAGYLNIRNGYKRYLSTFNYDTYSNDKIFSEMISYALSICPIVIEMENIYDVEEIRVSSIISYTLQSLNQQGGDFWDNPTNTRCVYHLKRLLKKFDTKIIRSSYHRDTFQNMDRSALDREQYLLFNVILMHAVYYLSSPYRLQALSTALKINDNIISDVQTFIRISGTRKLLAHLIELEIRAVKSLKKDSEEYL